MLSRRSKNTRRQKVGTIRFDYMSQDSAANVRNAFYMGVFGGFLVYMGTENWWLTVFASLISATLGAIFIILDSH